MSAAPGTPSPLQPKSPPRPLPLWRTSRDTTDTRRRLEITAVMTRPPPAPGPWWADSEAHASPCHGGFVMSR